MNSITTGPSLLIPVNRPPTNLPIEKPQEIDNDKLRQAAVGAIETKQQKELAERYVKAIVNPSSNNDFGNNVDLGDLQDAAQFAKRAKAVQVIDDNNGSLIKEVAESRRDKIESFFREINNPEEISSEQLIDNTI